MRLGSHNLRSGMFDTRLWVTSLKLIGQLDRLDETRSSSTKYPQLLMEGINSIQFLNKFSSIRDRNPPTFAVLRKRSRPKFNVL